jgi:hypothetical protein
MRVTNLDDAGPGSLRAAVEARVPRIVIFDVGGTIRLKKPLVVRHPRITIAGQSAPGGGITLRDYTLGISADDVVIRFIRSRLGDESGAVADAIWVTRGTRIILDHVSASWSTDEALSVTSGYRLPGRELGDVTVQWSIISESLCKSVNPDGRHCYGSILAGSRGARFSFHHNLWAHHAARMPRVGNSLPPAEDRQGAFFDIRSNVIYNWGGQVAGYGGLPAANVAYNFIDNSYWAGPNTRGLAMFREGNPHAKAFVSGNAMNGTQLANQSWSVTEAGATTYWLSEPLTIPAPTTDPASSAYTKVLAHAGASLHRDTVDARIVVEVANRTGRLIDSQRDVGGWPVLARGVPWADSDKDGMPDAWELKRRLDRHDPKDANYDPDGDGYTNVEQWLNELAESVVSRERTEHKTTGQPQV